MHRFVLIEADQEYFITLVSWVQVELYLCLCVFVVKYVCVCELICDAELQKLEVGKWSISHLKKLEAYERNF